MCIRDRIEKASLVPGEDEELEKQYRKLSNGRRIIDSLQSAHALTGYDGQGAGAAVGAALRELSRVTEYDEQLESLSQTLSEVDGLLNDFNRELSSYCLLYTSGTGAHAARECQEDRLQRPSSG